ncbi:hypothetical protein [Desulforhabdus sp. TSK]|uniref:hypothetical protein n=1 Tax=Desulforhabdus sp. TSK TaxID=2925014 RepID=UPI001FC811BA|nr:hypothetical protein [Desulforhabdus sp. TSK]GKT10792.1 hypothetical protein DSTSK_40970 [Desulforhabdus sp. TSK]
MDRSSSFSQRESMQGTRASGISERSGQMGQTARSQDRQAARTDRTQARSDLRGERQQTAADRTGNRQEERTERTGTRQENRTERTEGRQDVRSQRQQEVTERQKGRQDYYDDHYHHHDDDWDDWGGWGYVAAGAAVVAGAYAVGTIINAATYSTLSCTPTTVVVNGITYSQCGTTWYQPTYSGGDVTYIVVNPPPGY